MEFFPSSNQQQTEENFAKSFAKKDLPEVVAFRKQVYDNKILIKVLYPIKILSWYKSSFYGGLTGLTSWKAVLISLFVH